MKKLTKMREKAGLSKSKLSRLSDVQPNTITWAENGRFIPYDSQLERIANALGYEGKPSELLEEV